MLQVERKVVDATQIVDFLVTANDENLTDNHYLRTKTSESMRLFTFPWSEKRESREKRETITHVQFLLLSTIGRLRACVFRCRVYDQPYFSQRKFAPLSSSAISPTRKR